MNTGWGRWRLRMMDVERAKQQVKNLQATALMAGGMWEQNQSTGYAEKYFGVLISNVVDDTNAILETLKDGEK